MPPHFLAATTAGTFSSRDGGATWSEVLPDLTWDVSVRAVDAAAGSTSEAFATCRDGLHRSTDGGDTWTKAPLPGAPAKIVFGRGRMAVAHAPSDGNVVYVFAAAGDQGFLWRRTSLGGGFSEVDLPDLELGQASRPVTSSQSSRSKVPDPPPEAVVFYFKHPLVARTPRPRTLWIAASSWASAQAQVRYWTSTNWRSRAAAE